VPASIGFDLVPDVRKIVVLRVSALGDYIFTLPALYALKAAYPDAELTLLGAPWHVRVLSGRPGPVDRVVAVPAVPGVLGGDNAPGELDAFNRWAAGEGFDIALQMHGGGKYSSPFVRSLGARVTAGLRAPDAPVLDRWIPYMYYQPEVFRMLEVAGLVGATPVTHSPVFELTADDRAQVRAVLGPPGRPRVVLHPGASDPRRRWPAERFAAVGDTIAAAGVEVLVTGTGSEREIVDEVCGRMRHRARPVVDELTISGLAGLLADCAFVVSNDTGPLHVAAAVGTRTIGLFWVGNIINAALPERGRHRPLISWVIHCPECGLDCTRDIYPARTGGTGCLCAPSFIADIPVVEVAAEALNLLGAYRGDPELAPAGNR
jgi:ADP-heptose:LPS heptosyltransferase